MRAALILGTVIVAAVSLVHVLNYYRLGDARFDRNRTALLDRAREISSRARPSYQDEVLNSLPPNPLNGEVFRLDDHLDEAVTALNTVHTPAKDEDGVLLGFEFEDPEAPDLHSALSSSTLRIENGSLEVLHRSPDHLTHASEIVVPKDDIGEIRIRARVARGREMTLSWNPGERPSESWHNKISIDLIPDGEFHTYAINAKNVLQRGLKSGENLRRFLVRPSDVDGDRVEIDFIRLISKMAKYQRHSRGVEYETLGGETRSVLYMLPTQSLEYTLQIPASSPTLEFGIGILKDGAPIEIAVSISADKEPTRLFEKELDRAAQWQDVRLDLSAWAGKNVRLSLLASGSGPNVAFLSNPTVSSPPVERLNVVMILEDTLRADHLSSYGHHRPTSPMKDRLAEEGVLFLNAVSQATKTRPSVPSLMTSLLPSATGVLNWADALSERYLTLAEILRNQGFATASFIQNGNAGPYAGLHQGFGTILGPELLGAATEEIIGDRLMAWLERNEQRNFFVYIHTVDPHGPYDPPAPFDHWYRNRAPGGTPVKHSASHDPVHIEHPTMEGRRLLYDGEIQHNDSLLGDFVERLESLGLRENSLLVFVSDHGEHLGEHARWEHRPPGYRQVTRVPLLLMHPSKLREAKRIHPTVQLMDVMPTVLELAQVDSSALVFQGDSLVDLIEGRNLDYWENRISVSEEPMTMSAGKPCDCGSLFFDRWHLLNSTALRWEGVPAFLRWRIPQSLQLRVFDLLEDSEEMEWATWFLPDLVVKHRFQELMHDLQSTNIDAWRNWTAGDHEIQKLDPDTQEHLKALGYVQ
jgi:arylsulfatase A-like enzyme